MAKGDVLTTVAPKPIILYRKEAASQTIADGDPVGFDSAGDIILAVNTTDGPIRYRTKYQKKIGATTFFGVLMCGRIVGKAGGAIKPFKRLTVSSGSEVLQKTKQSISATPTQAEVQAVQNEFWRDAGMYICKESDISAVDGVVKASDAADDDLVVIEVGYFH